MTKIFNRIAIILEMIKFEHTVFALPFALMSAFIAARGLPSWQKIAWILVAMVGARSMAMAFNRIVDAELDAQNPRTRERALPAGKIKPVHVWFFTVASSLAFLLAASQLNSLTLKLSPVVIFVLCFYSYTKRFTWVCHIILGLSLGIAPVGAWIAIRGEIAAIPLLLGLGVLFWVAGFDIIYACLDFEYDLRENLFSIPKVLGIQWALIVSILFHLTTIGLFCWAGVAAHLGILFLAGIFLTTACLIYEHWIVRPKDLSRVNVSFFNINGIISILLFFFTIADLFLLSA
ncbi:MAG: UbiA family prenyltransferase [Candidatus Tectomicrobia bacterium]|uniref:4-hydroxybenzoate polyprenyltransferase n=1 Tax=Tectimicrobiota bacterium TaxID=2528274 RepID=A0A933GKM6_UNCTE|nr:UbiA family prenyltransferase [Candidatus Tectomicrobia bacterium]